MTILTSADYPDVRDSLGFGLTELPDALIADPQMAPAADLFIRSRVKNWVAIMTLAAPPAPSVAEGSVLASVFQPGTYPVALVAYAVDTPSPAGATADCVLTAVNQAILVTLPVQPGITSYDVYVGLADGLPLYRQAKNVTPGALLAVFGYQMLEALPAQDDRTALKSAAIAVCCANLCSRFQQQSPATLKTLTYEEMHTHDWRAEEKEYRKAASRYLGLISTYSPRLTIPPALLVGGGNSTVLVDDGFGVEELSSYRNG